MALRLYNKLTTIVNPAQKVSSQSFNVSTMNCYHNPLLRVNPTTYVKNLSVTCIGHILKSNVQYFSTSSKEPTLIRFVIDVFVGELINNSNEFALRIKYLLQNTTIKDFQSTYYFPLMQHTITCAMALLQFDPSMLENITQHHIDYTFYKDEPLKSQTVTEAFTINKTLGDYFTSNTGVLQNIAQNPDNPKGDHAQYAAKCYAIMKQPHGDFRSQVILSETLTNKINFYDVKLIGDPIKHLKLLRGHVSLTQNLHEDFLFKRHRGDIGTIINQKVLMKVEKQYLKTLREEISNLTMKSSGDNLQSYYSLLNQTDMNPFITSVVASRLVLADNNTYFDNIYQSFDQKTKHDLEALVYTMNISELIPATGQIVNIRVWVKQLELISKTLPDPYRKEALDNFDIYMKLITI